PETVDVVWVRRGNADAVVARFVRRAAGVPGVGGAPPPGAGAPAPGGAVGGIELDGKVIQTAQQGPISSEALGLTAAALILLVSLGTVIAAGLPLLLALFGLG